MLMESVHPSEKSAKLVSADSASGAVMYGNILPYLKSDDMHAS